MNSIFRIFQQYIFYLIYCKYFLSIVFSFVYIFLHIQIVWYIIYCNIVTIDVTISSNLSTNSIHDLRYVIDTLISVHALFISIRKKVHSTLAWCIQMIHTSLTKRFNFRRNSHCYGESIENEFNHVRRIDFILDNH